MEFNSIHRVSMLGIMKKYGVPENVIRMVKIFCEDFMRIKTKVIRINAKNQEMIMIAGQGIAEVDEFTYLGATFVLFVKREVV